MINLVEDVGHEKDVEDFNSFSFPVIKRQIELEIRKIPLDYCGIKLLGKIPADKTQKNKGLLVGISIKDIFLFEYTVGMATISPIIIVPFEDKEKLFSELASLIKEENQFNF